MSLQMFVLSAHRRRWRRRRRRCGPLLAGLRAEFADVAEVGLGFSAKFNANLAFATPLYFAVDLGAVVGNDQLEPIWYGGFALQHQLGATWAVVTHNAVNHRAQVMQKYPATLEHRPSTLTSNFWVGVVVAW